MNTRAIAFVGILLAAHAAGGMQSIAPTDTRIQVRGTRYADRSGEALRLPRFREDVLARPPKDLGLNPKKARNTSGVVLAFRTDSKTFSMTFQPADTEFRGMEFGVFENGKLVREFKFRKRKQAETIEFESASEGESLFEVALPSWAGVELTGMKIDDGSTLTEPTPPEKVYVALGDSITHGVGQGSATHKTWPFLLSRKLDMQIYNLAVGGAKVSVPVGQMLADWDKIDLITILVGYNDLHFDRKSPQQYREKYTELLDAIRGHHPNTPIYCISLLYTKKPVNQETGHTANEFRSSLSKFIKERSLHDPNLYFIEGEKVSSEESLRADVPNDPVHLGVAGAEMLADALATAIENGQTD